MIVKIYGEMHNKSRDIDRIRRLVLEQEPDIILHEMYEDDKEFYEDYDVEYVPLEPTFPSPRFDIRELVMTIEILKAMIEYKNIAVVVGDTHIRSQPVDDLGNSLIRSKLGKYKCIGFIRSPYSEVV